MEFAKIVECTKSLTYQKQGASLLNVNLMRSWWEIAHAILVMLITDLVEYITKSVQWLSVLETKYYLLMEYVHLALNQWSQYPKHNVLWTVG